MSTILPTSPLLRCQLTEWGLPPLIVSWFRKKGITSLFEWQVECLCKDNVLFGDNLVYSAPTSAGKTLVADFLLLKRVLEYNKKALVIEPFVALTREKAATLKSMLHTTKARVGAFGGSYYTPGGMAAVNVAVCTIEKANNFINKLISENRLSDLGIIVVDEIHYVGDELRGYQLELLLTKVLYYNTQQDKNKKIQIVGLSATIPNLQSIAVWLNASLFTTCYRPVPLEEKIKISDKIYKVSEFIRNPNCKPLHVVDPRRIPIEKDFDGLCYVCIDAIANGHSTLVFCESKRECEIMASNLAAQIKICGNKLDSDIPAHVEICKNLRANISKVKISDVLDKLKKCPAGADRELVKSLAFGVAFHHAGLTSEEREIIEDGFKSGGIKTLMATSTLSSGVNLPARKVVIKSPTMFTGGSGNYQKEMLHPITYRQMIGRAGRKNIDTCGESILNCSPENEKIAIKLIKASLGDINSSLGYRMIAEGESSGLKKAVLEVIANCTVKTRVNLNQYLKSTFWLSCTIRQEEQELMKSVTDTLKYLIINKFIEELKPGVYKSTRLGNAVLASGLNPGEALVILDDIVKARTRFILQNDLHIIFQVTPNETARSVELKDWQHYSQVWNQLDPLSQEVGLTVGINEVTIAKKCQGFLSNLEEEKERIYKKFWIALVICDLISELPLPKICLKYKVSKALVQQAQRNIAQFAGVVSTFCHELGYDNIEQVIHPIESRINFSCNRDVLNLIKLNITRDVARALLNGGYKDIFAIAKADSLDIEFVIRQIKPFKKDLSFNSATDEAPTMWIPELAKTMKTLDYAAHIIESARTYLKMEHDIDLYLPTSTAKRKDDSFFSDEEDNQQNVIDRITASPKKRGRLENGTNTGTGNIEVLKPSTSGKIIRDLSDLTEVPETTIPKTLLFKNELENLVHGQKSELDKMVLKANKDVPNFVVKYLGSDQRDLNRFMNEWIIRSSVSVNFKLAESVNGQIGANFKKPSNSRARNRLRSDLTSLDSDGNNNDISSPLSDTASSQDGLELQLEIDNKKHIVTRLYACFEDDFTVYIIDKKAAMKQIRQNLGEFLRRSYASATAETTTQQRAHFIPVKLYTQSIVLAYKVFYTAFGLDQLTLNRHFEWHAFDVAWWMVNDCPNRGLNNYNSSLSLVSKTKWVKKYHHFLYTSSKQRKRGTSSHIPEDIAPPRSHKEFLRLKDIVKAGKTAILQPLLKELLDELENREQLTAYYQAEIPSRLTMAHMMVHGMGLQMKSMKDELNLYENISQQLTDVAQKYYAKSNISLTNIRHVARVLYEDLDLKKHLLEHATNADVSKDPTNAEILNILGLYHPFPKLVQDFRKIGKALDALQSVNTHARYNSELNMMRVFGNCDFWQLTGRVAMSDPDLFLINRNFAITIPAHGNREEETIQCAPRGCFVPAKGWTYVSADYSQLELRILAHYSDDKNLLDVLNRSLDSEETYDVFKTLASKVYKKPLEEVTSENRQHAKQICYGIIYGMGNKTLANQLGVDMEQAEVFRQDFFSAFPKVLTYIDELLDECKQVGYVKSLLGRRRIIDGFDSDQSSLRSRAKRVAINTRIQSSASDIIKLAMQTMNQRILENFENNARLVLEMHDELIYEVNPVILNRFSKTLKYSMENLNFMESLRVKLLVNVKKGMDWSNLEKFNFEVNPHSRQDE